MVEVKIDTKALNKAFKALGAKAPGAMAETLTIVAQSCRKKLVKSLDDHFEIRRPWSASGMQSIKASRSRLVSEVGSTRPYMRDQVEGGTRDRAGAVPMVGADRPRRSIRDVTTPARWPGKLKAKDKNKKTPRLFVKPTASGKMGLWRKEGRSYKRKRGTGGRVIRATGIRLLYVFPDSVRVPKRWPMYEITQKHAAMKIGPAAQKAFDNAWKKVLK